MVTVRYGHLGDTERVIAMLSKVWEDDYVPHVWAEWVERPDMGLVFVAEHEGKIVGTCYVDFMTSNTCWFQAMRVHPDYRRLGVGSHLTSFCIQEARARGMQAAYLGIDSDNVASQTMTAKHGFVKILDYARLQTKLPASDMPPQNNNWRLATPEDIEEMYVLASTAHTPSVFACWQWEPLSREGLARNLENETIWVWAPDGIRVWAGFENCKPEFHLFAPQGSPADIRSAVEDFYGMIKSNTEVTLEVWMHSNDPLHQHLRDMGFEEIDGYTIWKYVLCPASAVV